jgi:hypothetical protein
VLSHCKPLTDDPPMLQGGALDLYSWLAASDDAEIALPAAVRIVRNALQALVPSEDDLPSRLKCGIISSGLEQLMQNIPPDPTEGCPPFPSGCATAGAPSAPPPQWQTDALDLAIRTLEQIGAPCCLHAACLSMCIYLGCCSLLQCHRCECHLCCVRSRGNLVAVLLVLLLYRN